MKRLVTPSALAVILAMDKRVSAGGALIYLDKFMAAAGNPTDPLERCLIEQLAIAHNRLNQLQVQASKATEAILIVACNQAVTRLMAEIRRHTLAVRAYRARNEPKSTTVTYVVQQQNIAQADGKQAVAFAEGESTPQTCVDSEKKGNGNESVADDLFEQRLRAADPACSGRT